MDSVCNYVKNKQNMATKNWRNSEWAGEYRPTVCLTYSEAAVDTNHKAVSYKW